MENKIKLQSDLTVDDKSVLFPTIATAINSVFGTQYKNIYKSWFIPAIFHEYGLESYHVWFPLSPKVKSNNEYINLLSPDGMQIIEGLANGEPWTPPTDRKRIVFYGEKYNNVKYYRFIGIFEYDGMENGCHMWTRTKDRVKNYN